MVAGRNLPSAESLRSSLPDRIPTAAPMLQLATSITPAKASGADQDLRCVPFCVVWIRAVLELFAWSDHARCRLSWQPK